MTDLNELLEVASNRWTSLESGWRAVSLGFLVVLAVLLGLPVPW
ncbi:hypothetical protein [Halomarina ordinaria]|uniref:Uncharacterized protein n=1 Tax=Halomarina ordinaria TaxID=3033939 RepID=A0ABD5UBN2_9EURY|nr:hypothetical protein [Halomarina sp. PSRA2]